jgi:glycosyltransferase involved in cell wall biosynthesis
VKLLHFNRIPPQAGGWVGGDYSHVQNTMKALSKFTNLDQWYGWAPSIDGNPVDVSRAEITPVDISRVDISSYDLVHIYHLTMQWGFAMAQRCMLEKKPYVITSIFYSRHHDLLAPIVNNSVITVAQSSNERREIIDVTGCDPDKVIVVSGGVDKTVFYPGVDDPNKVAVVNIGRIGPGKGILQLAESCKRLGLPYVQIGDFYNDAYGIKCLKLMTQHYRGLSSQQVATVLRQCKLYVCPSLSDRQSLGVLEGAACGLPIVDSIYNRGSDTLPSSLIVNPDNPKELDEAIRKQYWAPMNTDYVPTWDDAADKLKLYYDMAGQCVLRTTELL